MAKIKSQRSHPSSRSVSPKAIELRGVRVNNLSGLDLSVPHGQLLGVCGVSGSGKTSLAIETLYAEGQRRYVESFSTYARQFLERIDKPLAEGLSGIPPAVAWTHSAGKFGRRATLGSTTELSHYLRLLFTRASVIVCPACQLEVRSWSSTSVGDVLLKWPAGVKYQIGFRWKSEQPEHGWTPLIKGGFTRAVVHGQVRDLTDPQFPWANEAWVVVDRLVAGKVEPQRLWDSLAVASEAGQGAVWVARGVDEDIAAAFPAPAVEESWEGRRQVVWQLSREWRCGGCQQEFPPPEPARLSDNHPLGACPTCEGLGSVSDWDWGKIVPDERISIRDGAIAPWNSPSYVHEKEELLALADAVGLPVDIPFSRLTAVHRQLIWDGVPERNFGGLQGFFRWLERRKYKMHLRIYAARWRSFAECPACHGERLGPAAHVYRLDGLTYRDWEKLPLAELLQRLQRLRDQEGWSSAGELLAKRLEGPTQALTQLGLTYLSLTHSMLNLSHGERQRVLIGRLLRSSLVNLLYVFDEPLSGLHPDDAGRVVELLVELHQRGNTVVCVEHSGMALQQMERIVELGPEGGESGGQIIFDGTPVELRKRATSPTGLIWQGRYCGKPGRERRKPKLPGLAVLGCTGRYLQNVDCEIPWGVLTQVVGISGSGKSTLIRDTLCAALQVEFAGDHSPPLPFRELRGAERVNGIEIIDDSGLLRSSRSNPVTFLKIYDLIRKVFAESEEARSRALTPSHFSFNVSGGRCDKCNGEGWLTVDMHFLADMRRECDECRGARFRPEVLAAKYRGQNISEVLNLTAQQAFGFFRGQKKIQVGLKALLDVGLGYLRLGQSLATLSGGEEGRLKLAQALGGKSGQKQLFVLLRPTAGLHDREVLKLVDCLDALLAVGHTVVVVDNHLGLASYADWLIEMGPGPGPEGGLVENTGSPDDLASAPQSRFGRALRGFWNERFE